MSDANKEHILKDLASSEKFWMALVHELRSPISGIKCAIEQIKRQNEKILDSKCIRNLDYIDDCSSQIGIIVHGVNCLFMTSSGSLEKFHSIPSSILKNEIQEIIDSLSDKFNSSYIELTDLTNFCQQYPTIKYNSLALSSLLLVLFDNTLRYSDYESMSKVIVSYDTRNNLVNIEVTNKCSDLPDEFLNRGFDAGWRSCKLVHNLHGIGLGLTIAHAICERNEWTIELRENSKIVSVLISIPQTMEKDE